MNQQEIRSVLLEVIDAVAPGCIPEVVDDEADIREQMDLDSMDLLNIIAALHERLGIEVPEADMEQITTLRKAIAYLSRP
jgi:acyl carrier protein